jgi:hypothetical protein
MKRQRRLEEAVFERSTNGYALLKLAELEGRRNRELERALIQAKADAEREARLADFRVSDLLDEADELKREIEVLEQRAAELRQACETAEGLAVLLADVPEERLEQVLITLGHELIDEEGEQRACEVAT